MAVKIVHWIQDWQEIERRLPTIYDERIPLLVKRTLGGDPKVYYAREASLQKGALVIYPSQEKDPQRLDRSKEISLKEKMINPVGEEIPKAFIGFNETDYLNSSKPPRWTKSKPHDVPPPIASSPPVFWFSSYDELSLAYHQLKRIVLAPSYQGPWEIYETFSSPLCDSGNKLYIAVEPYYRDLNGERKTGWGSRALITRQEMDAGKLFVGLCTDEEVPQRVRRRSKSYPEQSTTQRSATLFSTTTNV